MGACAPSRLVVPGCAMKKKCSNCGLVNFSDAESCARCQAGLVETANVEAPKIGGKQRIVVRVIIFCGVCFVILLGFYLSLVVSAHPLSFEQKHQVRRAISLLKSKGFTQQVFLLENITIYRSDDNWLNASVAKENAYAATNFPFEIMTLYSDFFTYPTDDTERAAILLNEAEHLKGKNEHDAYEFVWIHRKQLGWTKGAYNASPVWRNIRRQTMDNAPSLFVCGEKELNDCTE